jgi:flagellar hook-associated protein 1 FlgK
MSIMMGIETAIRSLRTHTLAMNTAEHNIANMNNEWYSRQLANITSTAPYSQVGLAGQVGSGSKVGSFERIRDLYLDRQINQEREYLGMWDMLNRTYQNLKAIFPEVSGVDVGLNKQLDDFWAGWQKLADAAAAGNADDIKAAQLEIYQTAAGIASSFNSKSSTLTNMQIDLNTELRVTIQSINMYVKQIYELNKEIAVATNLGQRPNDLLDRRTMALAKLSELVNVNVGNRTDGSIVVHIHGHTLVNGVDGYNEMTTVGGAKDSKLEDVALFEFKGGKPVNIDTSIERGRLAGIIKSRDEVIHWYKSNLDSMANSLITVVNRIHRSGIIPSGTNESDVDFFVGNKASSIIVNPQLNAGLEIAYRKFESNDIAEAMANLKNKIINNSITSPRLGALETSASLLGRTGTITINGTIVNYNATDTIADLVRKINTNHSDFSAFFDNTERQFFIVANQMMTIRETYTSGNPTPLLERFKWEQEQISTGPINYSDSTAIGIVIGMDTYVNQTLKLDNEASKFGKIIMNFNGQKYAINWKETDLLLVTASNLNDFNAPAASPKLDAYTFDDAQHPQKFSFRSGINNGVAPGTILPFLISDEQGNMTQVMKLPGNLRFNEYYDMVIGKLTGELETGDNILGEYQAALDQLNAMQKSITQVDENQEIMQAKQYQRAYDASVRLMSVMDEMLNMLINRTASPSGSWD